jgi:uncharacterized protein YbjT (DUF2867 family)
MILVIGGTGLVGGKIVESLVDRQVQVRVLGGGLSDWRHTVTPLLRKAGVEIINGDIRDRQVLSRAVAGCTGIVHAAGAVTAPPGDSLASVNYESMSTLLPIAESAGVQRLLYISCSGASQFSASEYWQSKWHAEQLVRQSNLAWTILRPTLIFGRDSQLMRVLSFWVTRFPVVLVVGSGLNDLHPISADDVAACAVQALYNRDTVGQTYNLAGPEVINLYDLLELASSQEGGIRKPLFKIPARVGYSLAEILTKINPHTPLSVEWLKLLTADSTVDLTLMRQAFQVPMLPLESQYKPVLKSPHR